MANDMDIPPASDDETVQGYLDAKWRESLRAAREGMECCRNIYPELVQHLPETAANHIKNALDNFEAASRQLHKAGKHVLGQEVYDEYIQATTRRQIER